MEYEVVLTVAAREQLERIAYYLLCELESAQAASSVMDDAEATRRRLSHIAGGLKLCENEKLRKLGYRKIRFKRHDYFMLYRVEGNKVYIDKIYHDLQDYENEF